MQHRQEFFGVTDSAQETETNHSMSMEPALGILALCSADPGAAIINTTTKQSLRNPMAPPYRSHRAETVSPKGFRMRNPSGRPSPHALATQTWP